MALRILNPNKILSLILSMLLVFHQIALDAGSVQSRISKKTGLLTKVHLGKHYKAKPLILIRDVHAHPEVQANISEILKRLYVHEGLKNIFLEGAEDRIDTSYIDGLKDDEIRSELASRYLSKGFLTGAESFKIQQGSSSHLRLWGVEDSTLYVENLKDYREVLAKGDLARKALAELGRYLEDFCKRHFSASFLKWSHLKGSFEQDKIGIQAYWEKLKVLAIQQNIDWEKFESLSLFDEIQSKQSRLSSPEIEQELQALLNRLSNRLPQEELKHLLKMSLSVKLGHLDPMDYALELSKLSKDEISLFRNLKEYFHLLRMQKKLEFDQVLDQIAEVSEKVGLSYLKNERERQWYQFFKEYKNWKAMLDLEIMRSDFEALQNKKIRFRQWFSSLQELAEEFGKRFRLSKKKAYEIEHYLDEAQAFYEHAVKRDRALIQNTIAQLQEDESGVLITGGFHTAGIEKILQDLGVSYWVITPKMTQKIDVQNYHQMMLDTNLLIERAQLTAKILSGQIHGIRDDRDWKDRIGADALKSLIEKLRQPDESPRNIQDWLAAIQQYWDPYAILTPETVHNIILKVIPELLTLTQQEKRGLRRYLDRAIRMNRELLMQVFNTLLGESQDENLFSRSLEMLSTKSIAETGLSEVKDIHRDILQAIETGQVIALTSPILKKNFEALTPNELALRLTSQIEGMSEEARQRLEKMLAHPPTRKEILSAIGILQKAIENSQQKESLHDLRWVILLTKEGSFAEGKVLGHAGFQEKTQGTKKQRTIFLHQNTVKAGRFNPVGLQKLLEHESTDLMQGYHQFQSTKEKAALLLFWFQAFPKSRVQDTLMQFLRRTPFLHIVRNSALVFLLSCSSYVPRVSVLTDNFPPVATEGYPDEHLRHRDEVIKMVKENLKLVPPLHQYSIQGVVIHNLKTLPHPSHKDGVPAYFDPDTGKIHVAGKEMPALRTVFHEAGHAVFFRLISDKDREAYKKLSNDSGKKRKHFVSDYAMTNEREDFAETYEEWARNSKDLLDMVKDSALLKKKIMQVAKTFIFEKNGKSYLRTYNNFKPDDLLITDSDRVFKDYKSFSEFLKNGGALQIKKEKNIAEPGISEIEEIHPDISNAIREGHAIALTDEILKMDLTGLDPTRLTERLTSALTGVSREGLLHVHQLLSLDSLRSKILSAVENLRKTLLRTEAQSTLGSRRFVILLSERGAFAEGSALAHAGFREKSTGQKSMGTIYLHLKSALASIQYPEEFLALLEHEDGDLNRGYHAYANPQEERQVQKFWDQVFPQRWGLSSLEGAWTRREFIPTLVTLLAAMTLGSCARNRTYIMDEERGVASISIRGSKFDARTNRILQQGIRIVQETLGYLPALHLSAINDVVIYNEALLHREGFSFGLTGYYNDGRIELAGRNPPRRETIFHESGHAVFDRLLSEEQTNSYKNLYDESGGHRAHFVTDYAMRNEREDFAETYEEWTRHSANLIENAASSEILSRKLLFVARRFQFTSNGRTYLRIYRDFNPVDVEISEGETTFQNLNRLRNAIPRASSKMSKAFSPPMTILSSIGFLDGSPMSESTETPRTAELKKYREPLRRLVEKHGIQMTDPLWAEISSLLDGNDQALSLDDLRSEILTRENFSFENLQLVWELTELIDEITQGTLEEKTKKALALLALILRFAIEKTATAIRLPFNIQDLVLKALLGVPVTSAVALLPSQEKPREVARGRISGESRVVVEGLEPQERKLLIFNLKHLLAKYRGFDFSQARLKVVEGASRLLELDSETFTIDRRAFRSEALLALELGHEILEYIAARSKLAFAEPAVREGALIRMQLEAFEELSTDKKANLLKTLILSPDMDHGHFATLLYSTLDYKERQKADRHLVREIAQGELSTLRQSSLRTTDDEKWQAILDYLNQDIYDPLIRKSVQEGRENLLHQVKNELYPFLAKLHSLKDLTLDVAIQKWTREQFPDASNRDIQNWISIHPEEVQKEEAKEWIRVKRNGKLLLGWLGSSALIYYAVAMFQSGAYFVGITLSFFGVGALSYLLMKSLRDFWARTKGRRQPVIYDPNQKRIHVYPLFSGKKIRKEFKAALEKLALQLKQEEAERLRAIERDEKLLRDWSGIAEKKGLPKEMPSWFRHFANHEELYAAICRIAPFYAEYRSGLPQNNDPLLKLEMTLRERKDLLRRVLELVSAEGYSAMSIIEPLPEMANHLGGNPEDYELLIELAETIFRYSYPSSDAFMAMEVKPIFNKGDVRLAIQLAREGFNPAPLFTSIDDEFRVNVPLSHNEIERYKDLFLKALNDIFEGRGAFEEKAAILEATAESLALADPIEVAKLLGLQGLKEKLYLDRRVLIPYPQLKDNDPLLEFFESLPQGHPRHLYTIAFAPELEKALNYYGFIYLPANQFTEHTVDFESLARFIAESVYLGMSKAQQEEWTQLVDYSDMLIRYGQFLTAQNEKSPSAEFSKLYAKWITHVHSLILKANRDPILKIKLEMIASHFIIRTQEGKTLLRFYVPRYRPGDSFKDTLVRLAEGKDIPYDGFTSVDIPVKMDAPTLWPVILKAYQALMGPTFPEELNEALQGKKTIEKNIAEPGVSEIKDIHRDIEKALEKGDAIAITEETLEMPLFELGTDELVNQLTMNIDGFSQKAKKHLTKVMSDPERKKEILSSLKLLKETMGASQQNETLAYRRLVILLTESGPFAEGAVLGHAGFRKKAKGISDRGSIYFHLKTLNAARISENLHHAFTEFLEHENRDLNKGFHQGRRVGEDWNAIATLWHVVKTFDILDTPFPLFPNASDHLKLSGIDRSSHSKRIVDHSA